MNSVFRFCSLAVMTLAAMIPVAFADTYHSTNFSGQLGSSPNIKSPFNSVLSGGGSVSGSFVYDDQLVPAGGSGFVNVFFSGYPDVANIPSATALTINLGGGLVFTLDDAQFGAAAVQYNNGNFNGFFYVSDFTFLGNPYEFQVQSGTFNIVAIVDGFPQFSNLVSGTLNIGNSNLTGTTVFVPGTPTPPRISEPSSLMMLVGGVLTTASAALRKRKTLEASAKVEGSQ